MKLTKILLIHIKASGPVSFASCLTYAQLQYDPGIARYKVAEAMNELLANKEIKLYDDGESFV